MISTIIVYNILNGIEILKSREAKFFFKLLSKGKIQFILSVLEIFNEFDIERVAYLAINKKNVFV